MSASRTRAHIGWARSVFGLALGLAALLGLFTILHANAAPPPPVASVQPAAFNGGRPSPAMPSQPHIPSINASPLTRSATNYRTPSAPSTAMQPAPSTGAADTPFARANVDLDYVDGWFGAGATVQYTVSRLGHVIGGGTGTPKDDGWMDGIGCGCDMQPDDLVTVDSSAGFHALLVPIPINGNIDVATNVVSGQMSLGSFPAGQGSISVWSSASGEWFTLPTNIALDGTYATDFTPMVDIRSGDVAQVWYIDPSGNQVGTMLYTPYLIVRANRAHDWVQGEATPQTTVFVTVTRDGTEIGTGQSFTGGGMWWNVNPRQPNGKNVDMLTGDIVHVTAGAMSASLLLIEMDGAVDATTDVVSGKLIGVPFPANVRVEVWREGGESRDLTTNGQGNFSIDFGTFDLHQGDQVGIWYVRPDGHMVGVVRSDFRLETELRDNDVWGMTTPNTRVELTLLAGSTVKGTVTTWSDREGNFGNRFSTADGQSADVVAGDVINGAAGSKTAAMTIPQPFSAGYDHATDVVCGQAPASTQVQVDLWGFGTQNPVANATNNYCVTFDGNPGIEAEGETRFDTPMGHSAHVRFSTPSADLWLNKWSDGQPASGGYHRYVLRVGNGDQAGLPATGVILTDTLPAGMTFDSESTGTATDGGDRVVWHLDSMPPGTEREISLLVRVAASVTSGTEIENIAEVAVAGWERDTRNNTARDRRTVVENQADLSVDGSVMPGNPAPGAEYVYRIYYNNNRPAGARFVRVTSDLPSGTSFDSEWHPDGWTVDTSEAGKVIWQTDYLRGGSGGYLDLRLLVNGDATPGTTKLHNRVEIAGEMPDPNPGDNVWENDTGVQELYGDLSVDTWYSHGIPVAGYDYTTWVHVRNNANGPGTGAVLTDTLPAGATFVRAVHYAFDPATGDQNLRTTFPPTDQGTGWVRWNLPAVPNWRNFQMEVTFHIGAGTAPNTELINRVDVGLPGDQDLRNNHAEFSFRTQSPGPNLRVTKWYDWGEVTPGGNLQYQLRFENNGTEPLYDLVLKDILPDHVDLNGFGWDEQPVSEGKTLTWTPTWQLNPGEEHGFWLQVRVNDGTATGVVLTNTAQGSASTPEVITTDNSAQVALRVGPDLRVSKELLEPGLLPGQRAHYRVRIWNDGYANANSVVLTDTLPLGLTFAGSDWGGEVQGDQVIWHLGDRGAGWRGEFNMRVDVDPALEQCAKLSAQLDITNGQGDAVPGDNIFHLISRVQPCWLIRLPLCRRGN